MIRSLAVAMTLLVSHVAVAARAEWVAAPSTPLPTSSSRPPAAASGRALSIRFVPNGPKWTAQVHACERAQDARFAEDPGCGVLVLRSGRETRYLLIDDAVVVNDPQLKALSLPGGRKALLLSEARGLEHHADLWIAHLVEDDGAGPRLAMRVVIDACSWGDDGSKCARVSPTAKYVDADGDGDQDLELSFRGANGLARRDLFVRLPENRFALPARYLAKDSFLAEAQERILPPVGVADPVAGTPKQYLDCPWFVSTAPADVFKLRGGRGERVGSVVDEAAVEVAEARGPWTRIVTPIYGWVATTRLKQRCP